MKLNLFLFMLALGLSAQAQNLVPNPSFENYINCPSSLSEIPYSNTYSAFKSVSNWSNSVYGATPDYFNKCVPWPGPSVPQNTMGFQQSKTGNAYVGMITYNAFSSPSFPYKYVAEYIYCKLNSKLIAGKIYDVSFYVSATNRGGASSIHAVIDRIGAHLSDTIAYDSTNRRLIVPYHVRSTTGVYLDDTTSWVLISGTYIAKGGEEYLFIGNFDDGSTINVKHFNSNVPSQNFFSYYYIDDVSVKLVPCDTFSSVLDTMICNDEFITLSSSIDNADSYTWQQGQGNKSINIYESGTYWVVATKDTCDLYIDTFHVDLEQVVLPKIPLLKDDTALCKGLVYTIGQSLNENVVYKWNTGATECCIDVTKTGNYSVTITNECSSVSDNINIHFFECADCIWAPSAFTPNNDSKNDFFSVFSKCPILEYRLVIVNRWGEEIFTSNDISAAWDGKQNNIDVPIGSYYFLITYHTLLSNKTELIKGNITLIR